MLFAEEAAKEQLKNDYKNAQKLLQDDAAVIAACLKLISSDVDDYQKWRKDNNKVLDV